METPIVLAHRSVRVRDHGGVVRLGQFDQVAGDKTPASTCCMGICQWEKLRWEQSHPAPCPSVLSVLSSLEPGAIEKTGHSGSLSTKHMTVLSE